MKSKKVGILTWHYFLNFGSALQAYALKRTISQMGYDCRIIDYRDPRHGMPDKKKDICRLTLSRLLSWKGKVLGRNITYPFLRFQRGFLKLKLQAIDDAALVDKTKCFDTIVCGSDQIWAPNILNTRYLLDFAGENIKKVSYAASIGLENIPQEKQHLYKENLAQFKSISVREGKGRTLLRESCGVEATVVLDPTLLVDCSHWKTLQRKPTDIVFDENKPFLFCYFLNANHLYTEAVKQFAVANGLQIIGYSLNQADKEWMIDITKLIGPREFLWFVCNAATVITDSYHGTIFSLLNHKQFISLQRFRTSDELCQNSRIEQLNKHFDIAERIVEVDETTQLNVAQYDYEKFEQKLAALRKQSMRFLENALKGI